MAQERTLEQWAKREAEKRGWLCFKFKSPSQAGVPDRIFIAPPHPTLTNIIFVEFKAPGKTASRLQRYWMGIMRNFDCHIYLVDSKKAMLDIFEYYTDV